MGWRFYGFFVFCLAWVGGYFLWAWRMALADRRKARARGASGIASDGKLATRSGASGETVRP